MEDTLSTDEPLYVKEYLQRETKRMRETRPSVQSLILTEVISLHAAEVLRKIENGYAERLSRGREKLLAPMQSLGQEVTQLKNEVDRLRRENGELRAKVEERERMSDRGGPQPNMDQIKAELIREFKAREALATSRVMEEMARRKKEFDTIKRERDELSEQLNQIGSVFRRIKADNK